MAKDQPWLSDVCPKIEVVQTRAKGHPLLQSAFIGCLSGQHGISSAVCMPGMLLAIASIVALPEDAIALPASPMLIGPMTTASMATNKTNRRMASAHFMLVNLPSGHSF
jgi:hypothetical protein